MSSPAGMTAQDPIIVDSEPTTGAQLITFVYTMTFEFREQIDRPLTYKEFGDLVQAAVKDMGDQLPQHVKAYPNKIYEELAKRRLIDVVSFAQSARNANRSGG